MQSNSQKIKLSIITVNKNNAAGLERTIQSVINQIFKDFEYIIIDGASTDGSVDVIKKYEDKIDYWISEPDTGIYNAMNKGIRVARGEYLLFLNSGDHLVNDSVLEEVFKLEFNEDIVYGNILVNEEFEKKYPDYLTLKYFIKDTLPHPAALIKRKVFEKIGMYNEDYIIASDFEFFIKALILNNATYKHIDMPITVFYTNGISTVNQNITQQERKQILSALLPRIYFDYIECFEIKREFELFKNSKLVKLLYRFYKSKIYRFLKRIT